MHRALFTFQEPFSDPKSDKIYLRKIAVEMLGVPCIGNARYVQVCRKVMVGTTGDQKFAGLEKIIVPLESVKRDESKYVFCII